MTIARRLGGALLFVAVLTVLVSASDVTVTPIVTPDGKVVASFSVPGGITPDVRELVRSAVLVKFTFNVEVKRPAFLFDRTLGSVTVVASVKFDTLSGRYLVSKEQDGRVIFSESTDQEDQMRAWMTQFDRVPIDVRGALEPNAEYAIQVSLHVSPRLHFPIFPWGRNDGSGRAEFTFIR